MNGCSASCASLLMPRAGHRHSVRRLSSSGPSDWEELLPSPWLDASTAPSSSCARRMRTPQGSRQRSLHPASSCQESSHINKLCMHG